MTAYFIFRVLVALALAVVWYVLDRRFGVRWYRWWYDMTHEHPMTGESSQGLVHNRPARVRGFWAVLVASFVTVLSFFNGAFYPLLEIGLWAASVPAAFLGLLIAPRFFALWQKRDAAFDAVDKWERGEVDISEELKSRTTDLGSRLKRTVISVADAPVRTTPAAPAAPVASPAAEAKESPLPSTPAPAPEPATVTTPESVSAPAPAPPAPEAQDPQELVNRYINRGQRG